MMYVAKWAKEMKRKNETKQKQINFMNTWCKKQFEKILMYIYYIIYYL